MDGEMMINKSELLGFMDFLEKNYLFPKNVNKEMIIKEYFMSKGVEEVKQ